MAGTLHHAPRREGDPSLAAAIVRAAVTLVLVTAVVAAGLAGATWVASRALVGLLG
ncbi:hypothetical protein ACT8ZV_07235 [Nocardioides sp. MAHUQ-72]|uniref:hypothetical protein n=1 Tax=unclassified Nocardioides TaxID=2615069 RepID=UPI00362138ED